MDIEFQFGNSMWKGTEINFSIIFSLAMVWQSIKETW